MTCYLYRAFDIQGDLLYVGISKSALRRASEHLRNSPWAVDAAVIRISPFPSRAAAAEAERIAIQTEGPRANIVHATTRATPYRSGRHRNGPSVPGPRQRSGQAYFTTYEAAALLQISEHQFRELVKQQGRVGRTSQRGDLWHHSQCVAIAKSAAYA
jgi:hypothetical protein